MVSQTDQTVMAMLHAALKDLDKGDPASPPIVSTAKYVLPGDVDTPYTYGRDINPTVEACETALAALENAPVVAFPCGMAAITAALMTSLKAGQRILVPSDGYYVTRALLDEVLSGLGVEMQAIPTRDYDAADFEGFDVVWVETPSNPGLELCDIAQVSSRAKAAGAQIIVDNTTLTPLLQRPLDLGADIIVSSDTKAIAGHSDALFGHVATRDPEAFERVKRWRKLSGSIPGPLEAFLTYRGLMTLEVRLARMCSTASALATAIKEAQPDLQPKYPDIGFIIGMTFQSAEAADAFIDRCPAILAATSFGGAHTSAERRARWGDDVPEGYVRLSVGCEPKEALIEAVLEALS
ncbi:MAG: PLP-dependent transferase [Pseudomonadota bacterium]